MGRSSLIMCERRGTWAVAVRRHLPLELRLRETRSAADCLAELAAAPASLVALELTRARPEVALSLVREIDLAFPLARSVVMADRGLESWEWLVREAGAVHFTTSPRDAAALARLASRHAARAPVPKLSFAALIWESLHWPDAAS
jgi:hypothetical protein